MTDVAPTFVHKGKNGDASPSYMPHMKQGGFTIYDTWRGKLKPFTSGEDPCESAEISPEVDKEVEDAFAEAFGS